MKTIIGIPQTNNTDGIVMELSSKEHCINEICELRKTIINIQTDLKKFIGMKAYDSIGSFEKKYIEDAIKECYSALNVQYVSE